MSDNILSNWKLYSRLQEDFDHEEEELITALVGLKRMRSAPIYRQRWQESYLRNLAVRENSFLTEYRLNPSSFDLLVNMLEPALKVDSDMGGCISALVAAVAVPDKETTISSRVTSALKIALDIDRIVSERTNAYFKEQFPILSFQCDGGMAATLHSALSPIDTSASDPKYFLAYAIFEHKVGNGLGDHQCAVDYLNAVAKSRSESTSGPHMSKYLGPLHDELVSDGFSHPALAIIVEERNLRFEALHWGPEGVVMARLGSCDLRPDNAHAQCAVVLTAARRCLEALAMLNESVAASLDNSNVSGDKWIPHAVRSPTSLISCAALPDVNDLLAPHLVGAVTNPLWEVNQVQAWRHSQVFRCQLQSRSDGVSADLQSHRPLMLKLSDCTDPTEVESLHKRNEVMMKCWRVLSGDTLAPTLHSSTVLGTWKIIVADWLDNGWQTLHEVLKGITASSGEVAMIQLEELRSYVVAAVNRMHQLGIVHGDLRDVNVMIRGSFESGQWEVQFIDFDWACRDGEGCYPLNLNVSTVKRPSEVYPGGTIFAQHDLDQLALHFYEILNRL